MQHLQQADTHRMLEQLFSCDMGLHSDTKDVQRGFRVVSIPMSCRCTQMYPGRKIGKHAQLSMTPLAAPNPTALKPYRQLLNLLTKLDNRMGRCLKGSVR